MVTSLAMEHSWTLTFRIPTLGFNTAVCWDDLATVRETAAAVLGSSNQLTGLACVCTACCLSGQSCQRIGTIPWNLLQTILNDVPCVSHSAETSPTGLLDQVPETWCLGCPEGFPASSRVVLVPWSVVILILFPGVHHLPVGGVSHRLGNGQLRTAASRWTSRWWTAARWRRL